MTFKELLDEVTNLIYKLKAEEETLKFYREKSFSISSPLYGVERTNTQPSGKAPFEKWIYKSIEQEKIINELQEQLINKEDNIITFLKSYGDLEFLKFIPYRYFDRLSYVEIAEKMKISRSKIYKIKDKIEANLMNLEII